MIMQIIMIQSYELIVYPLPLSTETINIQDITIKNSNDCRLKATCHFVVGSMVAWSHFTNMQQGMNLILYIKY